MAASLDPVVFWLKAPKMSFKLLTLSYSAVSWALMPVSALICELTVVCWFCSCTSGWPPLHQLADDRADIDAAGLSAEGVVHIVTMLLMVLP